MNLQASDVLVGNHTPIDVREPRCRHSTIATDVAPEKWTKGNAVSYEDDFCSTEVSREFCPLEPLKVVDEIRRHQIVISHDSDHHVLTAKAEQQRHRHRKR
jgi:hypothetical protein